jgi:hypothetical protein
MERMAQARVSPPEWLATRPASSVRMVWISQQEQAQ